MNQQNKEGDNDIEMQDKQDNRVINNNNIINNVNVVNNNYINIEENINEIEEYYNREPVNSDMISEYCSHTLYAESKKQKLLIGNLSEEDYNEQGIFKVIKSNYKPHKNYLVTINKKDLTYFIETC